jgi:hypothetical protein
MHPSKAATGVRDAWLRLDNDALLRQCRQGSYRSSGPGGQRRNKVATGVRLHHEPSGMSAQAAETRSHEENRIRALRRLREQIALGVRQPLDLDAPSLPPEFVAQRGQKGSLSINQRNPTYPIVVATALDALAVAGGSYARAARPLGITTSQLLRLLRSDPAVWRVSESMRSKAKSEHATAGL